MRDDAKHGIRQKCATTVFDEVIPMHGKIRGALDQVMGRLAHWSRVAGLGIACCLILLVVGVEGTQAQDLEPRSYTNTPVGLHFLLAGYLYTEGRIAFDPSLPVADGQYNTNNGVIAYARSLGVWGKSAKFDGVVPYSSFSGQALSSGQSLRREITGFGDPLFRFSINFYGAPALSMKEFKSYRQRLIVGVSFQVSPPLGQYDDTKLINLGSNRWSFKTEMGMSKALGSWRLELIPAATFYTENTDFNRGGRFSESPRYSVQGHIVYGFRSGVWLAVGSTYFTGSRNTVNGVRTDTLQTNTRVGLVVTLPVDRHNSVKLTASANTSTRTGSKFDAIGLVWQYRWGGR
jgi:hypothetical protein